MTALFRESLPVDSDAILALYPLAFPDEDLIPLVAALLPHEGVMSLVGVQDDEIIAHGLYTAGVSTAGDDHLALLGPLAVHPDHQRAGVGTALMAQATDRLTAAGIREILVLGNPDYYRPRGFDEQARISPPFPLKPEWAQDWRSMALGDAARATGELILPAPWMTPDYWR